MIQPAKWISYISTNINKHNILIQTHEYNIEFLEYLFVFFNDD